MFLDVDVAIVGAGAAGLAAARRLRSRPLKIVVLEARDRIGGRAHTIRAPADLPLDLGCGWLHSADRNPLVPIAGELGFGIDKTPPGWSQPLAQPGLSEEDGAAFSRAFEDFEARLERAATAGIEGAAADYFDPDSRWNPRLNAFSSYYNGAEFDRVSVQDYAAYHDSNINWRVAEGYGALIAALGAESRIELQSPVSVIDRSGGLLALETPRGILHARTAIVTVPTSLIAGERIRFRPALPEKIEAASGLPLGLADKVFLATDTPGRLPANTHLTGRMDRAETGSYLLRPLGRPYVEGYFGGRQARFLENLGEDDFAQFAIDELAALLGSGIRRHLRPLRATAWGLDPFALGSYSHALPGHAGDRARLAAPVDNRLFFAGEACSARSFSTAHGAYETGIAAAEQAMSALDF